MVDELPKKTLTKRKKVNLVVKYILTDFFLFSIEEMQGCAPSLESTDASLL